MSIDITTLALAKEYTNRMVGSGGTGGGVDGGYYTPGVTQPTTDTMQISFAPSKSDMPAVNPVTVNLPVSENSGQNVDLTGYATEQWVQNNYQPKGDYLTAVPVATAENLGGVKPTIAKDETMTQPVAADEDGGLWTAAGASGTVLVAASDAPDIVKAAAQYVCTGVNDQLTINTAIRTVGKGEVRLSGGNYNITGEIVLLDNITLAGRNAIINVCDEISSAIIQAYIGGDTVIHVEDASKFVVGQKVSPGHIINGQFDCHIVEIDKSANTVTLDNPFFTSSGFDANTSRLVADFTAVSCRSRKNVIVDGISVNGNGSSYGAYDTYFGGNGIELNDSENCKIVNCTIRDARKHGVAIFASTACNVEHSLVDSCYDLGIDVSNRLGGTGGHNIVGCTIRKTRIGKGVQIHYGVKVNVVGCVIHDNYQGIGTQGTGRELVVSGCNIYGNTTDGVICNAGDAVVVTGNIIEGNKLGGIQMDGATNGVISDNLVFGNTDYGIKILGSNHCIISGNRLYGNCDANTESTIGSKAAIVIRKACSYALVTGNNIQITSTNTAGCPCGIAESELTGDNNIVVNNVIRGARVAATKKLGANSKFENNYEFA